MLEVRDLEVDYGKHAALRGVSLDVAEGETVVILGANGAGKSSLLKAVAGLVAPRAGSRITLDARSLLGRPAHRIVEDGIALVPEGRGIFPELTVAENLMLGAWPARARATERATLAGILELFPRLAERRRQTVATMSGGERQMVAIGRALMSAPRLLMLDEPSLGLAPVLVGELFAALGAVGRGGTSLLIVEQNVRASLAIAARGYLLEAGRVVGHGPAASLADDPAVQHAFLGVAPQA